ncbi:hypothetical protein ACFY12_12935 [Streptomyces sp. NPDC001339]|uniref:hypothetical protein n=1 Tax=Streptomyces sp. NPDC001339 TaxID=3364563 RepID=UPI0036B3AA6C
MTALNGQRPATASHDTERPVPRWAVVTAHAIPFVLLPHCLWRLPFAFNFTMGTIDPNASPMPWPWGVPYVFGLSVLTEALALLCFGLVRGWGETAPGWLPVIGGKRIPPLAAIIPATLGGLAATALWGSGLLAWLHVPGFHALGYSNGWWELLARLSISPAMLWGPMVLALTYAYYVRRCRPAQSGVHRSAP